MRGLYVFLVMLILPASGFAQAPDDRVRLESELAQIATWLEGTYSNTAQTETAANILKVSPPAPDDAPDLLFAHFKRVTAPQVGNIVFYLQWHKGSLDGELQRQRIWRFRPDPARNAVTMDFYTIADPDRWRDLHERPAAALTLSPDDLKGYPPECPLPFRRFITVYIGEIPDGCVLPSRTRGGDMDLNARVVIGDGQVWYDEGAIHIPSGDVIFDVPASGAYQFQKIAD